MTNECTNTRISDKQTRKSSIELLKIVAIFLIVISHVTQTLGSENTHVGYQDYVILLGNATTDIQVVILMLLRQTGALGNSIFFVCSAWFLVGKKVDTKEKAFSLMSTVWVISIIIMCIYLIVCPSYLSIKDIIKQIFPTCFANNWYMTCYIIFLFIYPLINKLIDIIDQKQLLRITLFCSALWIIMDYVKGDLFFPSVLILWISIYFLIAYLKIYCAHIMQNIRVGITVLIIGIIGYIAQVVVTNYVGLYLIDAFSDDVLRWNTNCSPFYIMISIGSIIIALQMEYKVKFINYISSLSMLVYLIHENYLFRFYTRPAIWQYLYTNFGYSHVVLLDLGVAVILFIVSTIISMIYKETLQRAVTVVSKRIYLCIVKVYSKVETAILKI